VGVTIAWVGEDIQFTTIKQAFVGVANITNDVPERGGSSIKWLYGNAVGGGIGVSIKESVLLGEEELSGNEELPFGSEIDSLSGKLI
jgi:hypothetical protein